MDSNNQKKIHRPVLLIDGLNFFIRHFIANPSMSEHGDHIGGVMGSLKGIQLLCERYQPSKVIIAWEGGGSIRRKSLDSSYKNNRRPQKLNRFYEDIPNTIENRNDQISTLVALLRQTTVNQIYVSNCEADDIIAYLVKYKFHNNIIVSSDKDLYQLLDDNTYQWSPNQKKLIHTADVIDKFGVHPTNFCAVRCFVGDAGDGIKGAKGAGFKSISRRFPIVGTSESVSVGDIVTFSKEMLEKKSLKIYESIINFEDQAAINWKLMYLDTANLSASQIIKINNGIQQEGRAMNKLAFLRLLRNKGITNFSYDRFFVSLSTL